MKKLFKIQGQYDAVDEKFLYWSNKIGWVFFNSATVFSFTDSIRLPMDTTGIAWLDENGEISSVDRQEFTGKAQIFS
jgi:hypothetical protein